MAKRLRRRKKAKKQLPTTKAAEVEVVEAKPRKAPTTQDLINALTSGVMALEATLFTQASAECNRLQKLSSALTTLERQLFDPEVLETLDLKEKLTLYREARKSQETILSFLQHLHSMSLGTKDVLAFVDQLEKERSKAEEGGKQEETNQQKLQQFKQLVAEVLLKKRLSSS